MFLYINNILSRNTEMRVFLCKIFDSFVKKNVMKAKWIWLLICMICQIYISNIFSSRTDFKLQHNSKNDITCYAISWVVQIFMWYHFGMP